MTNIRKAPVFLYGVLPAHTLSGYDYQGSSVISLHHLRQRRYQVVIARQQNNGENNPQSPTPISYPTPWHLGTWHLAP